MLKRSLLLSLALALTMSAAGAEVTVTKTDYKGWTDACRMTNGAVELMLVPQVGRAMRYAYTGGKNVFWENEALAGKTTPDAEKALKDWPNYGGDKLWNSPQSLWGWPPDPTYDSMPHQLSVLPNNHVVMVSPLSKQFGIRFKREFILANQGTQVTIKNTMINESGKPVEFGVWEVAQADNPDMLTMPAYKEGAFWKGLFMMSHENEAVEAQDNVRIRGGIIEHTRLKDRGEKIGGDTPDPWICLHAGNVRYTIRADYQPDKTYPDRGCTVEAYSSQDPFQYMEMELMSPLAKLGNGKSTTFTTYWSLQKVGD